MEILDILPFAPTRTRTIEFPPASVTTSLPLGVANRLYVPSVDAPAATLLVVDMDGNARVAWREPGAVNISGIPSHDGRRVAIWIRRRSANLWLAEASD